MEHCIHCGGTLAKHNETAYTCEACGYKQYNNPRAAVGLILYKDEETLYLGRRAREPFKGDWDIFGGFVDFEENLEEALARELTEELGITIKDIGELEYLTSVNEDYPWMGHVTKVMVAVFAAKLAPSVELVAQDDVAAIEEVTREQIPGIIETTREPVAAALRVLQERATNENPRS